MRGRGHSPDVLRRALRLAQLIVGDELTLTEAAKRQGVSVSTASRLFRVAKEAEMVRRYVVPPENLPIEPEITSDRLQGTQEAVQEALALRGVEVISAPQVLTGKDRFNCAQDETLTQILGQAAARHVLSLLRDRDVLGVGGGRSLHFTATALSNERRAMRGLTVVSLAGGMGIYPLADGPPLLMSADASAALAAHGLNAVRVVRRGEAGYQPPGSRLRFFWNVDDRGPIKPNVAVVGIGALAKSIHTCFNQLRLELDEEGLRLAEEIISRAENIRRQLKEQHIQPCGALYSPVADVLARPFVVTAPGEVLSLIHQEEFQSLASAVEDMAERVYAASPEQLAGIDHVVVVAGGARKAFPIWDFFTRFLQTGTPGARRHSLVTDYWTASDLIAIAECTGTDHRLQAAEDQTQPDP